MLEEVVVNVWLEERLVSIWTVDSSNGNVLSGIRKKLWKTVLCTSKTILISEGFINGIQTKVSTMLEKVFVNVWLEERLVSISTLDSSYGNVVYGIRKKLWKTVLWTSKSIVISEASTKAIKTKVSTMLEEVVVIVWVEEGLVFIRTVDSSYGNVLWGIRKKMWKTVLCTSKSIVISQASSNGV